MSKNWAMVGSEMFTIPALKDHKNIPMMTVRVTNLSFNILLFESNNLTPLNIAGY